MSKSELEEAFATRIKQLSLPEPVREHQFMDSRKFKLDFAWPDLMIGVEINGGTWSRGAHGRGAGIHRDYVKMNLAQINGWKVLQFDTNDVESGNAALVTEYAIRRAQGVVGQVQP